MKIKNFTVSNAFDTFNNGEKQNHFLSVNFELDDPITLDEFKTVQLDASYRVTVSVIHDALARGSISVEQANERITVLTKRTEQLKASIEKKSQL